VTESFRPIPALAIVDSRNLIGQAGVHSLPEPDLSYDGLCMAMSDYGFEVKEVAIGLGLARGATSRALAAVHAENMALRSKFAKRGAKILEGELHYEDSVLKEKMVDSLCVLELARYAHEGLPEHVKVVLLLSRDLDLLPGATYATQRGVKTFVVSSDADYLRHSQRILLTAASYRTLTGVTSAQSEAGTLVAQFLSDPGPHEWKIGSQVVLMGQKGFLLDHESGVRGFVLATTTTTYMSEDLVTLVAADVIFDRETPLVYCSDDFQMATDRPWLKRSTIDLRRDASRVELEIGGRVFSVKCPVGLAEPGQEVLVRTQGGLYNQQAPARLVAPMQSPSNVQLERGRLALGRPTPVLVEHIDVNKTITARTASGLKTNLMVSIGVHPRVGHWYAAVPSELDRAAPRMTLVSSELL